MEGKNFPRLRSLSALEAVDSPLSEGTEDRLQDVLKALEEAENIPIKTVILLESRKQLPPIWQKIWNRVEALGATFTENNRMGHTGSKNIFKINLLIVLRIYLYNSTLNTAVFFCPFYPTHPHKISGFEFLIDVQEDDKANPWYHDSYDADPWSTSRQLLEWRDIKIAK
ncbi:hypothetical protein HP1_131 [Candidatus Termititenax spirochaetophilus]|uniref:Uncharacterized protein n=1 Tax=Candidatus Termititenax spirochaetophilus TaxID=2218522 RepID=A0A388T7X1_9BACT|nr:hypothetical protein HP1_131 [Candidatus Termititenax spirochaetophilus]